MDQQSIGEAQTEEFISTQFELFLSDIIGAIGFCSADINELYNDIVFDLETQYSWPMFCAFNPWAKKLKVESLKEDLDAAWNTYIDKQLDEWTPPFERVI